jgi:hypothetical protein
VFPQGFGRSDSVGANGGKDKGRTFNPALSHTCRTENKMQQQLEKNNVIPTTSQSPELGMCGYQEFFAKRL